MSAQIVLVASGKGGTGKSVLSVLAGARLAAHGRRVLLIETADSLRSIDIICGCSAQTVYDLKDVLCGRCEGAKAMVESPLYPGLFVISAPYQGGEVTPEALKSLTDSLRDDYDFILLDTSGMGSAFRAAVQVSTRALLVLTPDPVCLRDGSLLADALHTAGVTDLRLVLNRVTPQSFGPARSVADLDECIDTVCIQLIAVVPESAPLHDAAAAGQPLAADPALTAADCLARRLTGELVPLSVRFLKY